jgi:hypothetical protein
LQRWTSFSASRNFGYSFFFVGDDQRLPFVSVANSDNDFDGVSNLDREGVFRIKVGVSKGSVGRLAAVQDDRRTVTQPVERDPVAVA